MAKKETLKTVEETKPKKIEPVKVEPTTVEAINPRLSPLPAASHTAGLLNKHTNRVVYMNYKSAQSMVRANPNQFEIVS